MQFIAIAKPCRSHCVLAALALIFFVYAAPLRAQGGPPFRTDDPETPGNGHWEINFGFIGDRNPAAGAYQIPDFDFNYGLGDRIQLKYELPIAMEETRPQPAAPDLPAVRGSVIGGLGESLLGVKWRFYEHHPSDAVFRNRFGTGLLPVFQRASRPCPTTQSIASMPSASGDSPGAVDAPRQAVNLSFGTYPQLYLNNPTGTVRRGVVAPGPDFYLPLEFNGRIGPIRFDSEIGYNFGNHALPQSWGRGTIVGHQFSDRTEAYLELYDQQDANRIRSGLGVGQFVTGVPKQREATLGLGGRQSLNRAGTLNLLLMGGRSFQAVSPQNNQPSWIAYVGMQVLLGSKERE